MKILYLLTFLLASTSAMAQTDAFCGEHKYDGEHRNEVQGFAEVGKNNVVNSVYGGISGTYTRHITDYLDVLGTVGAQAKKDIYTVALETRYRLPLGKPNLYVNARYLFNNYHAYELNEHSWNVGITWEARYWDIHLGAYQTTFASFGSSYTEPVSTQFSVGANIRPREHSWNLGFFIRNYEYFYYDNWNINWGLRWNANATKRIKLFGEFVVRPAGSMSQLANNYEWKFKVGAKYAW